MLDMIPLHLTLGENVISRCGDMSIGYFGYYLGELADSGCVQGKNSGPLLVDQDHSQPVSFLDQLKQWPNPWLRRPAGPGGNINLQITMPPEFSRRIAEYYQALSLRSVVLQETHYTPPL